MNRQSLNTYIVVHMFFQRSTSAIFIDGQVSTFHVIHTQILKLISFSKL